MLENEVHVGELDHQRNRLMWDTTHHSITTWRGSAPITDSHLENSTPPYHLLQYDWVNSLIFFCFLFLLEESCGGRWISGQHVKFLRYRIGYSNGDRGIFFLKH